MLHSMGSHIKSSHTDTSFTSALWRDADDVKLWECKESSGGCRPKTGGVTDSRAAFTSDSDADTFIQERAFFNQPVL